MPGRIQHFLAVCLAVFRRFSESFFLEFLSSFLSVDPDCCLLLRCL